MSEHKFEYGPVSKGIYMALIAFGLVVPYIYPDKTVHYFFFIVFLGLGLRPLLEITGLHSLFQAINDSIFGKSKRRKLEQRRREIDLKLRNEKYKKSRFRDSRLPKNW